MATEIPMDAVDRYRDGASVSTLAREIGVGTNRLRDFLRENGVLRSPSEGKQMGWSRLTPEERQRRFPRKSPAAFEDSQVDELYRSGLNTNQIASQLRVDQRRVREVIFRLGHSGVYNRSCIFCRERFMSASPKQAICSGCVPPDEKIFYGRAVKHGVTKKVWDSMIKNQNGHCALCNREATCVDHDHITNRVRGLVCNGCNFALSRLDENRDWVAKALSYVAKGT